MCCHCFCACVSGWQATGAIIGAERSECAGSVACGRHMHWRLCACHVRPLSCTVAGAASLSSFCVAVPAVAPYWDGGVVLDCVVVRGMLVGVLQSPEVVRVGTAEQEVF